MTRWVYAAAALLLGISAIGLMSATGAVHHARVVLRGGQPAVVYEPGPTREFVESPDFSARLPVVVLAHGFAGNAGMMSALARSLAGAGYAVVALEFRGHGGNRTPLAESRDAIRSGLVEDLEAAVLYARTQAHYDGERVAVAGHSLGGFAALEYASRDPSLAATVVISAGLRPTGPYTPPNTLLIWAERDPRLLRDLARDAAAAFVGVERVVLDRTYGDPERGSAVRATQLDGVNHQTILYSAEVARRIVDWLELTLGAGVDGDKRPGSDPRVRWSVLAALACLALFWGIARELSPFVPRVSLPEVDRPLRALATLVIALAVVVGVLGSVDERGTRGPFGFLPISAGGDLLGYLGLAGILLLFDTARRGVFHTRGLADLPTWIAAALLAGFGYLAIGICLQPLVDLWLAPHRLPWALAGAILALPFYGATELLLRGPRRSGVWAPVLGRIAVVAGVLAGALLGLLPPVLGLAVGSIALGFAWFEICAYRLSRECPSPWLAALVQSAWTGWLVAALFPLVA